MVASAASVMTTSATRVMVVLPTAVCLNDMSRERLDCGL